MHVALGNPTFSIPGIRGGRQGKTGRRGAVKKRMGSSSNGKASSGSGRSKPKKVTLKDRWGKKSALYATIFRDFKGKTENTHEAR